MDEDNNLSEPELPEEEQVAVEEPSAAYDIPSAPDDKRTPVMTAFLVYVTTDGKAIGTSEVETTLAQIRPKREATLDDIRRAGIEVAADVGLVLQTQSIIQTQMQMARQAQEQMAAQQVAQGLDLSKMRNGGSR
jgi:hypothetical protein